MRYRYRTESSRRRWPSPLWRGVFCSSSSERFTVCAPRAFQSIIEFFIKFLFIYSTFDLISRKRLQNNLSVATCDEPSLFSVIKECGQRAFFIQYSIRRELIRSRPYEVIYYVYIDEYITPIGKSRKSYPSNVYE